MIKWIVIIGLFLASVDYQDKIAKLEVRVSALEKQVVK